MNMKKINPNLNILLSVGGYQHGTKPFVAMASSPEARRIFIKHSITYLRKYGFDGIDIDWETPGSEDNPIQEKRMFTNLIKVGENLSNLLILETHHYFFQAILKYNNEIEEKAFKRIILIGKPSCFQLNCMWVLISEHCPSISKQLLHFWQELRDAYEVEYRDTNTSTGRLLISIAVSPHKHAIDNGYHPSMLGK